MRIQITFVARFLALSLILLLTNCQDDDMVQKVEKDSTLIEGFVNVNKQSLEEIPQIGEFLKQRAGKNIFKSTDMSREGKGNVIFDLENVSISKDTLNRVNYIFNFIYPETPENIIYNLIVPVDENGIEEEPYIIRYVSNPATYKEFEVSNYNFNYFTGNIDLYRFDDFFTDENILQAQIDCTQHDQYGDPIPCQQIIVSDGSSGGGGGSTGTGTGTSTGTSTGTGSGTSGSGGYGISIYHIIPDGTNRMYLLGPGSQCQHNNQCQIVIIIDALPNYSKEILLENSVECPECTVVTSSTPTTTPTVTPEMKVNKFAGLTYTTMTADQKDWLAAREDLILGLMEFMRANQYTDDARQMAQKFFFMEYALGHRNGTIVQNSAYPDEISSCCPGDCCPPEFYDEEFDMMWQMGPGIIHGAIDGTFNIIWSTAELFGSDEWVGSRVRTIMGDIGIEVPTDIDNQTLGRIFQIRKRDLSLTIEYRTGVVRNIVSLGIDLLDVLALTSPSKGGGAFLAVKGGGKVTLGALKDYLTTLSKGTWQTVSESMSDAAKSYQEFISGRKWNESFVLNNAKFDGLKNGVLSDAKSGMLDFVNSDGTFKSFFNGKDGIISQAQRQRIAAGDLPIEWHFEHESVRLAFENLLAPLNLNIKFIYTPR